MIQAFLPDRWQKLALTTRPVFVLAWVLKKQPVIQLPNGKPATVPLDVGGRMIGCLGEKVERLFGSCVGRWFGRWFGGGLEAGWEVVWRLGEASGEVPGEVSGEVPGEVSGRAP